MENRKPYVRIQSQKTIQVTVGLQNEDHTNVDAHVPDRLKVSSLWPKAMIIIKAGAHLYPSEIVDWPTVRALEKDEVITIGAFEDQANAEVVKKREELLMGLKTVGAAYKEEVKPEIKEEIKQEIKEEIKVEPVEQVKEQVNEETTSTMSLAEKINAMRLSDIAK